MLRLALRTSLASTFLLAACSDDSSQADDESSSSGGDDDGDDDDDDDDDGPSTLTMTSADTSSSDADGSSTDGASTSGVDSSSDDRSDDESESESESGSASESESESSTTDTSVCGDGTADDDETCDLGDLNDETCISQDFDGGMLGCERSCDAFDTSACFLFSCGNDLIEGKEVCDGDDLADATCESLDFDAGTLACAAGCNAFDTSGCVLFSCGNGAVEGVEACDGADLAGSTCGSLNFDGGDLACANDCTFDTTGCFDNPCGNGLLDDAEVCDGSNLDGADCTTAGFDGGDLACADDCTALDTSACFDIVCGDAIVNGTEACDGANLAGQSCPALGSIGGALACNADCTLDSTGCLATVQETEPNDDGVTAVGVDDFSAANANGPFTADTFIHAGLSPAGDDDVFAVTNTSAGYALLSIETFGPGGVGTCDGMDTVVDVRTAANTNVTGNDDGGINTCSLVAAWPMAPGETLYVRVYEYQDNAAIASYFVDLRLVPVVCGDGVPQGNEQCDDGNTDVGDGCDSTCQLEQVVAEIEPNGDAAEADATGLVLVGDDLVGGAIGVIGDHDVYRLELATDDVVRFETFSANGVCSAISTTLRLRDSAFVQIVTDDISGISNCSAITMPLSAGTYYVEVEETGNNAAIPSYFLQVQGQTDEGIEIEPNDTLATADLQIQTAGSDIFIFGDHLLNADSDYFAIDILVAGSSLRLETIEGDRAVETCESFGIDSRLTLFTADGTQLSDDDDEGRGWCSLLDGTGDVPLDAGAHNLAAGTYYVQVRQSGSAGMLNGQFIYRLVATVRTP